MYKIALDAGHGPETSGKRCSKKLDPNETREYTLNSRICDYIAEYLNDYEGYELLRVDNSEEDVALSTRVAAANGFKADVYLSIHHNAGAKNTKSGGIVAYVYPRTDAATRAMRDDLYASLIKHTGLVGNRANPKPSADFYVLRKTTMPAVLLELGFMDSVTDVPVILTNEYARNCAAAICEILIERGKLTKKPEKLYRVQVGAFKRKANADRLVDDLISKGYSAYIVQEA